jgi:cytochrome c oxidase subunit 1
LTRAYFTTRYDYYCSDRIKILAGLQHLWGGSIKFDTPMLFTFGFLFVYHWWCNRVVLANSGINAILHDTYYVVAHFHYVDGCRFAMIAGFILGW